MKLNQKQQMWIDALRSGHYEQTTETLRSINKFCCLGVACDLSDISDWDDDDEYLGNSEGMPQEVADYYSFKSRFGEIKYSNGVSPFSDDEPDFESLAEMNDSGRYTFNALADFIEHHAEMVFD